MNKTARAREITAGFPNTPDGRYQAASVLMSELGITRNHARVLIHAALRTTTTRGGKRIGAGRRKKAQ